MKTAANTRHNGLTERRREPIALGFAISAPSRLHFGLLSTAANPGGLKYGGAGVMIAAPRTVVRFDPSDSWKIVGPGADRVRAVLTRANEAGLTERPATITIESRPPSHVGFGSGTQLAMSTAAGLLRLAGAVEHDVSRIAELAGRGLRSAIGAHGFLQGGFLWELGKSSDEALSPLSGSVRLPESWRVVLCRPREAIGRSGRDEHEAMQAVGLQAARRVQLAKLLEYELAPAAAADDLVRFGNALRAYGRASGEMFAGVQGGAFASPRLSRLADEMERAGLHGVGQSSWGPVMFGFCASEQIAQACCRALRRNLAGTCVTTTSIDNSGAFVEPC